MAMGERSAVGLPKRGGVKKKIFKDIKHGCTTATNAIANAKVVVKNYKCVAEEAFKGVFKKRNKSEAVKKLSLDESIANVRADNDHPVAMASSSDASSVAAVAVEFPVHPHPVAMANATDATAGAEGYVDLFLGKLPFPRRSNSAERWPDVDISNVLVHEGSALYQDQKGKWAVTNADEVIVPPTQPNRRIATAVLYTAV